MNKTLAKSLYNKEYYQLYNRNFKAFSRKNFTTGGRSWPARIHFKNKKVLDIGCGRGELLLYALSKGAISAVGIDCSPVALALAQKNVSRADKKLQSGFEVYKMNAEKLEFDAASFDVVTMFDIVEHLSPLELEQSLDEVYRVLKPGGKVFIHTSPNRYLVTVAKLVAKVLGTTLKSEKFRVNEQTCFSLKKNLRRFECTVSLEREKDYWSKQMGSRNKLFKLSACALDFVLDAPLISGTLDRKPLNIFFATDLWCVGKKPKRHDPLGKILSKVGDLNFRRRVVKMLDYLDVQRGDKILDAGCGEGFYEVIFDKLYNCEVVAIDSDTKLLKMAKGWLKGAWGISFEKADLCKLPFEDNTFDKIVCTEVIEHIEDDHKAVRELFRVLKPGGVLAATVPNKNYPLMWDPLNKIRASLGLGHFNPKNCLLGGIWAYDHKRLYLPRELRNLLRDMGFKVEKLEVLTHYGVPFNHLVLYLGKQFYTKLPVPKEVKSSMEKFEWENSPKKKALFGRLVSSVLSLGLGFLKWVDGKNDRRFPLSTPTMVVAIKAVKPK